MMDMGNLRKGSSKGTQKNWRWVRGDSEMLERRKVVLLFPGQEKQRVHLRLSVCFWGWWKAGRASFEIGRALGRLFMKIPAFAFRNRKTDGKRPSREVKSHLSAQYRPPGSSQLSACQLPEPTPSVLLQAFPSPSITLWLLIYREPGTQSWVYCLASLPHMHIHKAAM